MRCERGGRPSFMGRGSHSACVPNARPGKPLSGLEGYDWALGIHQTKVSKLLRGITEGFSPDRLLGILNGLDQAIIIRPRPQSEQRKAHVSAAVMSA